jgi:aspartyl-tRNA(Asn)/glutamyl-tRNA(Gln) amidotransferase subunit A
VNGRPDTAAGAASAIAAGGLSPVELTEHLLRRIEATEPALNAYVTVTAEAALADAQVLADELAAGTVRGPLHGVPVGIKDLIDTAGVRTTYGSPRFANHIPTRDAEAVRRWRQAGVVVLGKHATHELAWGGRTDSAFYGPTHNPYRRGHVPGGSSGGSAASVVAGSSLGALGSDTAGSVRIPAALSGCVGFKPSRGRVPMNGVLPLAPSLDHLGVLARTVDDAALLLGGVADPAPGSPVTSLRIGWLGGWFDAVLAPGVRDAMARTRQMLEDAGVMVVDVHVPDEPLMPEAVLARIVAEAGAFHRAAFEAEPTAFGEDVAALLRMPAATREETAASEAAVGRVAEVVHQALASCDVLMSATVPITAPPIGADTVTVDGRPWPVELLLTRLTSTFNATGLPAASVPVALADGLPVGLQVVGSRTRDSVVLEAARLVEQLSGPLPAPSLTEGVAESEGPA